MDHVTNAFQDHSGQLTQNQIRVLKHQIKMYQLLLRIHNLRFRENVIWQTVVQIPASARAALYRWNLGGPLAAYLQNRAIFTRDYGPRTGPLPFFNQQIRPSTSVAANATTSASENWIECSFCLIKSADALCLESCKHVFCRLCLQHSIQFSKEPQIPCPCRQSKNCNGFLLDPEIKSLVSTEIFEEYLSRSLKAALKDNNDLKHCFMTGCQGMCAIDDDMWSFYCPLCSKLNCLKCKKIHDRPCTESSPRKRSSNSAEESDACPLPAKVGMKGPTNYTPEDIVLKKQWDDSWDDLCTKFQSSRNKEGSERNESVQANDGSQNDAIGNRDRIHIDSACITADLMLTDKGFECPICLLDISPQEGLILQECFHRFCRECLAATIQHSTQPEVKCPFQSGNYSCASLILDKEIKALVTKEVYDLHLKKSLNSAEIKMANSFHCKLVNCPGWAEIEGGVRTFICTNCLMPNCVSCKAIHQELTCSEYQQRLQDGECDPASQKRINGIISSGKAMRCPTCKVVIEKNGGCDGLTCPVCKTLICWPTKGPRWGPKGHGDTSGGCGCSPWKKCHPKCTYCH